MDCIFCKIIRKEIPNYTVYEDEFVLAFLDIQPIAKGHTLVIPKTHAETLLDMSVEDAAALMQGVQQALAKVKEVIRPEGFNIGLNHGKVGGQVVPHVHVHIIPRSQTDGGGNMHSIVNAPGDIPVSDIAALFTQAP